MNTFIKRLHAGSVKTGWQVVMRSRSPYGPYEQRIVMAQGDTDINGPHQGGWVVSPYSPKGPTVAGWTSTGYTLISF